MIEFLTPLQKTGVLGTLFCLSLLTIAYLFKKLMDTTENFQRSVEKINTDNLQANEKSTEKYIELHKEQGQMFNTLHERTLQELRNRN